MGESDQITLKEAEIRHRTANGFQMLSSLARIRAARSVCPEARDSLRRIADQIRAVAHLQTLLARSSSRGLANHLREMQPVWARIGEDRGIEVRARLENAPEVPGHCSTPLALIANEAVTNCFEHAFPDHRKGTVEVCLSGTKEGHIFLTITDDGVGFETPPEDARRQGCRLIRDLAQNAGGNVAWRPNPLGGSLLFVVLSPGTRSSGQICADA